MVCTQKSWQGCVWPLDKERHREGFKLNWEGEGDSRSEGEIEEGYTISGTERTALMGPNYIVHKNIGRRAGHKQHCI